MRLFFLTLSDGLPFRLILVTRLQVMDRRKRGERTSCQKLLGKTTLYWWLEIILLNGQTGGTQYQAKGRLRSW